MESTELLNKTGVGSVLCKGNHPLSCAQHPSWSPLCQIRCQMRMSKAVVSIYVKSGMNLTISYLVSRRVSIPCLVCNTHRGILNLKPGLTSVREEVNLFCYVFQKFINET